MDIPIEIKIDFKAVKYDLLKAIHECSQRGLAQTVKWLAEVNYAFKHITLLSEEMPQHVEDYENELEEFFHGKKKLDNMTDTNCPPDPTKNDCLKDLCTELKIDYYDNKLDGYCLYLYGVILKKLDLGTLAIDIFIKAVKAEPLLWCAWYELGKIIPDKNKIFSAQLPDHWMKYFFIAHAYLEQLNNDESLQIYNTLYTMGLENSTYVMSQIALGHHNRRTKAQDKTAGNYYSLRSDHAKAVLYFRRALKLNPQFLSAWTLMGHEFMEMKNTNAAIQSYRHAIEINARDYRAWYGLGQTYEILKMPNYCLHYYKQAQQLKPNDSRMVIALGEAYEKLDETENALKCYYKACNLGDVEGTALIKLAKEEDRDIKCFEEQVEFYNALQYLANYHLKKGELDDAYTYAYKCMECEETKEQGKALLKSIAARRIEQEPDQGVAINETIANMSMANEEEVNSSNMDMAFSPSTI
ncbi:hypothetical protein NQ317_010036 [Molorchus minor]|uniref:Cdc23 domain-containing protein n=1 Tax=Molorchus minor TaxID=1323400 RepID=A0ABQ9J7I2_9CUCU|nr:hypothetical protein NQ317_010036 [Molorchus minor]